MVVYAIDFLDTHILRNLKHRYCYLSHWAYLHLLSKSDEMRQQAKKKQVPMQLFRVFSQYTL